jgi:hypothetical protein
MAEPTPDHAAHTREWTGSVLQYAVAFVNEGAWVRVEVNSRRALERVQQLLPVGSRIELSQAPDAVFSLIEKDSVGPGDAPHCLFLDRVLLQSSPDLEPLMRRLESELHFAVASNARASLFVHAGVVGWQDQAILLPGPSMSGKSSLVAALLRAGADYYSDEYAIIDSQGRVHPYAKPLLLREPEAECQSGGGYSRRGQVGTRPMHASLIVSTRYSPGAHFAPAVRGPSRGLMILVANTLLIRERPRFALDHLMPIAGGATTLEGIRGDADETAALLLRYQKPGT